MHTLVLPAYWPFTLSSVMCLMVRELTVLVILRTSLVPIWKIHTHTHTHTHTHVNHYFNTITVVFHIEYFGLFLTMVTRISCGRRRCFCRRGFSTSCRVLLDFTTIPIVPPVQASDTLRRQAHSLEMSTVSCHPSCVRW